MDGGIRDIQQQLLDLERDGASIKSIVEAFNSGIELIPDGYEGVSFFTTYIYLRKRLKSSDDNLHGIFASGRKILEEKFGRDWDPESKFRRNFAYFLYTRIKNADEAHNMWKEILASGWGKEAAAWLEAVRLEREYGSVENARKLLYQAVNSVSDSPYDVLNYFIQFEREEGNRDQVDKALEKVNARTSRLQKDESKKSKRKEVKDDRQNNVKRKKPDEQVLTPKYAENIPAEEPPVDNKAAVSPVVEEKMEVDSNDKPTVSTMASNAAKTVFVSNLPHQFTKEQLSELFPYSVNVRMPMSTKIRNKGFAYVDFDDPLEVIEALKMDGELVKEGRTIHISEFRPHGPGEKAEAKYSTEKEKNKIFVRNVHFEATEDEIRSFFSPFGDIRELRRVLHPNGKPKPIAFVVFESEESARKALSADKMEFKGRILDVEISDPSAARTPKDRSTSEEPKIAVIPKNSIFALKPRVLIEKK